MLAHKASELTRNTSRAVMTQRGIACMSVALLTLLSGCRSIDYDSPRNPSTFMESASQSYFGREAALAIADQPDDKSGFVPIIDGVDAIGARISLAYSAEHTLDVQYYLMKWDLTGKQLIWELLQAADRGVRVRLLLDDMFTRGYDHPLMVLDAHPDIELRVFNPFNRGALGRSLGAVPRFSSINRRMHNKSFTADNQVTIIGGRNIADEYFGARTDSAFSDVDVVATGPVVQEVSEMFDRYWNHEASLPAPAFLPAIEDPDSALMALRQDLKNHELEVLKTRYADAVQESMLRLLDLDGSQIVWSHYDLIFDPPDKGIKGRAKDEDLITESILRSLLDAKREIVIISPYFVPGKAFSKALIDAVANGLEVKVFTNSLAANNQKLVHGGYTPHRKKLLRGGVQLFELRPDARVAGTEYVPEDARRSTLHTKAYLLDQERVFIGSFNFDPRSAYINTEMGVLINDPPLTQNLLASIDKHMPTRVWALSIDENGRITWTTVDEDGSTSTESKEPMTNWFQRFMAGSYRLLPIRSQL